MHGSRELEVTRKTKFRPGKEEDLRKSIYKKNKHSKDHKKSEPSGFDMWGDEVNDGC
jgi:hypothetical protein